MAEGTSNQSHDLRIPQPPNDGWLSRRLRYPLLYATKDQVTKGETQTYPTRKDLKQITRSDYLHTIRKVRAGTLDLRSKPCFKECLSRDGYGC